jgi:hypothetical protein
MKGKDIKRVKRSINVNTKNIETSAPAFLVFLYGCGQFLTSGQISLPLISTTFVH